MMIETEENRMEIEAKERVVFDVSRYYGDEGREVSAMDLMEREGIDESELLARFTEDDIFCHAMDLLDVDLQEEMDCLALYFDEASSRSYGGPNAYGNPNAGNRIVVQGSSRTWRGTGSGMEVYEDFRRAIDNAPSYRMLGNVFADCEMQKVWDENGSLFLTGAHHDGGVSVEMRQLTDKGEDLLSEYLDFEGELVLPDSPVALMGSTYSEGDEGRLLSDLWSEEELCARPRYMERAFGCPIEEYAVERDGSGITFRIKGIDRDTLAYDEGYRFDVQVLTDGYDCGNGRFCKSLDEAHEYCDGLSGRKNDERDAACWRGRRL